MVYITHDIDWLNPWHPFALAKTATHVTKWLRLSQLRNRSVFLSGIEKLLCVNQNNSAEAIWLIGASTQNTYQAKGLRYTFNDSDFNNAIHTLKSAHVKVGLHSVSTESVYDQAIRLSTKIQEKVLFHRSHFLNFNPNTLYPQLQQAGVTTDFSLGTARNITLGHTQPINNELNLVHTTLFDNIFFFQKPEAVFEQFKATLQLAQARHQHTAVLFHPENFLINPALWEYYQEVLHIIKSTH